MNINDYVRTKKARRLNVMIAKIEDIREVDIDKILYYLDNNSSERCVCEDYEISKSSPNILELLEPMDLLYVDISPDDCGGIVVPRIPETLDELERYIEKIKSGGYILKYVVTHEQLENDMYKVGE